jgi:hypothetical protein
MDGWEFNYLPWKKEDLDTSVNQSGLTETKLLWYVMGYMVRDGVHGGADAATYRRWKYNDSAYDAKIAGATTHTRWLQIKQCIKLCDNEVEPKRGEPGYNPVYKYDYLFKVLISNINELSAKADADLYGDETTISVNAFGESGCDLIKRVKGKPGVTKGAQIVLVSDVHRNCPRAYFHRHNTHPKIPGITTQGNLEVRRVMEGILPLVKGELKGRKDKRCQIFDDKPHIVHGTTSSQEMSS